MLGGGEENMDSVYSGEKMVVRRLTPTECLRLQGFPDGWVDIGDWVDEKGKVHKDSDSAKYKAIGNSIALPFWFYLLRRISAQYERPATMGSLFSGIGGFDLCWTRCNGVGSVLWESEVEGFPIAVTKKHFGDEDAGIEGDVKEYL
jgi:DNA (cytosine-5)-methyltransferase 1